MYILIENMRKLMHISSAFFTCIAIKNWTFSEKLLYFNCYILREAFLVMLPSITLRNLRKN
jgi:hypothetical protein